MLIWGQFVLAQGSPAGSRKPHSHCSQVHSSGQESSEMTTKKPRLKLRVQSHALQNWHHREGERLASSQHHLKLHQYRGVEYVSVRIPWGTRTPCRNAKLALTYNHTVFPKCRAELKLTAFLRTHILCCIPRLPKQSQEQSLQIGPRYPHLK